MRREQSDVDLSGERIANQASDKILVVIPCLNEREHIETLLGYVRTNMAELDCLVVIADGGSTDGTADILARASAEDSRIKVIFNPKRIQSAGVNLAARAFGAGRRWLIRLDAHAQYPVRYIETLIAEARRTAAASVVVAMRSHGNACFQAAVAVVQNSILGSGGSTHRRLGKAQYVDSGHHALFDLQHFTAIGGYDETASHNEDAELDIRLVRAGHRIWLTRAAEVVYFPRTTAGALYHQYFCYGRGRATTLVRHRKLPKLRQLLPAAVVPAIAASVLAPWHPVLGVPALIWATLCLLTGAARGLRLGGRGALFAGLAAMTIHFAWSVGFWWQIIARLRHRKIAAFNAVRATSDTAS
jgi:succinoglycan biosynthesis protein ExoA